MRTKKLRVMEEREPQGEDVDVSGIPENLMEVVARLWNTPTANPRAARVGDWRVPLARGWSRHRPKYP